MFGDAWGASEYTEVRDMGDLFDPVPSCAKCHGSESFTPTPSHRNEQRNGTATYSYCGSFLGTFFLDLGIDSSKTASLLRGNHGEPVLEKP